MQLAVVMRLAAVMRRCFKNELQCYCLASVCDVAAEMSDNATGCLNASLLASNFVRLIIVMFLTCRQ